MYSTVLYSTEPTRQKSKHSVCSPLTSPWYRHRTMCAMTQPQSVVMSSCNDALDNGVTTLASLSLELLAKIVECCCIISGREDDACVLESGSGQTQCASPVISWSVWKVAMPMWSVCRTTREALIMWTRSIEWIDLGGEVLNSKVSFLSIASLWTNVHNLNMSHCKGVDDCVISAIAHHCPLLTNLNVELCYDVTDAGGVQIALKCAMLTHIYMGACAVTDTTIVKLAHHCKKLTHVAVPLCAVTNEAICELANHCKLVALNIMKTERDKSSDAAHLPSTCSELEHLNARVTNDDMRRIVASCPKLTHFSCSISYELTDAGIETLVAATPSLKHLAMSGCRNLTFVSVVNVAQRYASTLVHLDLSHISVTKEAIGAVASNCHNLTYLSLHSCKNVGDAVVKELHGRCLKLREVDFSETAINDTSLIFFLYHFEILDVGNNDEVKQVVMKDRSHMETLHLTGCKKITDPALVSVVISCPNLANLHVDMCEGVTMTGIRTVLSGCKRLKHIWWTEPEDESASVAGV